MSEIYEKKGKDTLTVTRIVNEVHIVEEDRAEIQTLLDHAELDMTRFVVDQQKKIDELKAKLAILKAGEK